MLEIFRRVVILTFVLGAVWMALNPAPALLRVATVDFVKEQQRDRKRSLGFDTRTSLPLDQYIVEKTRDRLIKVQGEIWVDFYDRISETTQGKLTDPQWTRRLGVDILRDSIFFGIGEEPLASVTNNLSPDHPFSYLAISNETRTLYLGVTYSVPIYASRDAPAALLYPHRHYSLWLLVAGFMLYLFLPWPKSPPEAIVCSRWRAVVIPDLLGVGLCAIFFGLPFFIITGNSPEPGVLNFSRGWGYLTLVLWAFTLAGLAILAFSAWYAKHQIRLLPDRLVQETLWGEKELPFAEMVSVRPIQWRPPRWLILLGFLISLLNWRATGPTLMLMGESNDGISISLKDGHTARIWLSGLKEGERVLEALQEAGVAMKGFTTDEGGC